MPQKEKYSRTVKGLIFDLDGTLTLTQQFHYQAFKKIFKKYGLDYTQSDDYRYAGQGSNCIFPGIFKEHNLPITPEETEQYAHEKKLAYKQILQKSKIKTVPGIEKFLAQMKKLGLKMIVASGNKAEFIDLILKKVKIRKYFSDFITNKDVKKSKPAPDIFLKAAERLGFKPSECLVFEDAVSGVKAAKKAKIRCIALTTGVSREELSKAGAWSTVPDYYEIPVPCFLENTE